MIITLNGNNHELPGDSTTVARLLEQLELADAPAAVEVNKQVVPKAQHGEHVLQAGDVVEIVTLVGGG